MVDRIALEFAQYVLQQNPKAKSFVAMYDAMSRAANLRSFRNLGPEELARIGISFSLLATAKLEHLIEEARKALAGQYVESTKEVKRTITFDGRKRETLPLVAQPNSISPSPLIMSIREAIHH